MARLAVVGVIVLWVLQPAPGVAHLGVDDPWHTAQDLLHAPEAACREDRHLGLTLPGYGRRGGAVRLTHFGSLHVSSLTLPLQDSGIASASTSLQYQSRVFPVIMASKRHTRSEWRSRCHSPTNSELTWSIGWWRSAIALPGC